MKKLLLLFGIAMFAVSCVDPAEYSWFWVIKNNTEQTLILKFPSYVGITSQHDIYTISPDKQIVIYNRKPGKRSLQFNTYFEHIVDLHGNDASWQILSEDDKLLKTWTYSEREQPDQRFFDESSWQFSQSKRPNVVPYIDYVWTFDILPEDIDPK